MKTASPDARPRKLGRPLSFNRDLALRQAMLTFWQHGYETTSVADLTAAMGVNAPSLYAAFGDKKQLFLEAVRLYAGEPEAMAQAIRDAPTAREAARDLLTAAATAYTSEATPRGCLLASATASGSPAAADVRQAVADVRRGVRHSLMVRIERDIADAVLPATTDAGMLSGVVVAVIQGMSVLARDGATREDLVSIAQGALHAWPSKAVK